MLAGIFSTSVICESKIKTNSANNTIAELYLNAAIFVYTVTEVIWMFSVIDTKQKFFTTSELMDQGLSYYKINQLVKNGALKKINKRTYENAFYSEEENDFYTAMAYVPDGVICLMSAAMYYGLTTYIPEAVDVAIDRKKKVSTLPAWPQIKLYYFSSERMAKGVTIVREGSNFFRIYSIKKTVVDIVYYRNKVGVEETAEVLRNYLQRKDRQPNLLYACAKSLRCEKVLRTYLEVLL